MTAGNDQLPALGEERKSETQLDPAGQALAEALRLSFGILRLLLVGLLIAYSLSGLFSVGSNEVALRLRFGDYVGGAGQQVLDQGTYLAAPFPIEQVITIDTRPQTIQLEREFWYERGPGEQGRTRAEIRRSRSGPLDPTRDGSLLTADLNIVHARWTVTYRIADPVAYLTNVGDPDLARELVRCTIAQGIVHTVARMPADEVLRASVNRDAAAGIARERLAEMETGLTIDQLALDEVAAPASVAESFEAVTTAETGRSRQIVAAEQERARILGETAGQASDKLLALIESYELARAAGSETEAEALGEAIDTAFGTLEIDGLQIGGEVARRINAAQTHRSRVVEEVRADRDEFSRLLSEYRQHPRLVRSSLWEACRAKIFTGDVETFYTTPGQLELELNRDPAVQKERQQRQMQGGQSGGRGR